VAGARAQTQTAAPAEALVENVRHFEPSEVRLAWNNRRWQLVYRNEVLKDFGFHQQPAWQALRLIQELKINEHGTVGAPQPVMEYWLANGQAPNGPVRASLRSLPLDPAALRVEQMQGQWCLRDNQRVLFSFGAHADEAQKALGVMHKYHFSQVGVLGNGVPSMYVFLAPPEGTGLLTPSQRAAGSSRQLNVPHFSRLARNSDGTPRKEGAEPANAPLAGVVSPLLPSVSRPAVGVTGPVQPTLTTRQMPLWHSQGRQPGGQPAMGTEVPQRVPFDWRRVEVRQGPRGEWTLGAGSLVLANFGADANQARLALAALRHYRFTEQWRVAGEPAGLTYYVANGATPRGLMLGLNGRSFLPEKLVVKQVGERWSLCSGEDVVLHVGPRANDAKQMLETIKKSKVDQVCQMGEAGKEAVTMLVRSR
jgi:hypothetical protein